jgi:hypothetical protein
MEIHNGIRPQSDPHVAIMIHRHLALINTRGDFWLPNLISGSFVPNNPTCTRVCPEENCSPLFCSSFCKPSLDQQHAILLTAPENTQKL